MPDSARRRLLPSSASSPSDAVAVTPTSGLWVLVGSTLAPASVVNDSHILTVIPPATSPSPVPVERQLNVSFDGVSFVTVGSVVEDYSSCAVVNEQFDAGYVLSVRDDAMLISVAVCARDSALTLRSDGAATCAERSLRRPAAVADWMRYL